MRMYNIKYSLRLYSKGTNVHFAQVGESKFSAHRIVLAAAIPYFHAMFTSDMVESKQEEITMSGIEPR